MTDIYKDIKQTMINYARAERNRLLAESDKFVLCDYPITPENLILVKEYRQKLRDYFELSEVVSFIDDTLFKLPLFPDFPAFN